MIISAANIRPLVEVAITQIRGTTCEGVMADSNKHMVNEENQSTSQADNIGNIEPLQQKGEDTHMPPNSVNDEEQHPKHAKPDLPSNISAVGTAGNDITGNDSVHMDADTNPLPNVMDTSTFVMPTAPTVSATGANPRQQTQERKYPGNYKEAFTPLDLLKGTKQPDNPPERRRGGALMRMKTWQKVVLGVCIVVILLIVAYGLGSLYWSDRFYPNTSVGTVDLSGKTFDEADRIQYSVPDDVVLTVTDDAVGTVDELTSSDIGVSYDYAGALATLKDGHASTLWFVDLLSSQEYRETPHVSYDENAVNEAVSNMSCLTADRTEPVDASLTYENGTFSIKPEQQGTALDTEKLMQAVRDAISDGQQTINIADLGIYDQPARTSSSQELVDAMERGQKMLGAEVAFTDGDSEKKIPRDSIASWLYIGDDGLTVDVDEDGVAGWMRELGKEYDTAGTERQFTTTNGNTITVSGGDYGWITDEPAMVQQAVAAIENGESQTFDIAWKQSAAQHGDNEWGGTYVEVSIADQHVWCYKDGELALSCDVVTGKPDGKHDTDTGVYTIKMKASPWVMTGEDEDGDGEPDYRTPCTYFMLWTNTGIAFHDATWQAAFGGQRYKQGYGSHGCVNMPYSMAQQLWGLIANGDPVICY